MCLPFRLRRWKPVELVRALCCVSITLLTPVIWTLETATGETFHQPPQITTLRYDEDRSYVADIPMASRHWPGHTKEIPLTGIQGFCGKSSDELSTTCDAFAKATRMRGRQAGPKWSYGNEIRFRYEHFTNFNGSPEVTDGFL